MKQFESEAGRYIVFLFKTNCFSGELISSKEGRMIWIKRDSLAQYDTVNDLEELIHVIETDSLNEFQYVGSKGNRELFIF